MRQFIVCDKIEGKIKKFYNFQDAREEARRIILIYKKLNNKVEIIQKDANFYIDFKKEVEK